MTIKPRLSAGLAAITALALTACGDQARDEDTSTTTTRLDAVEVPQGTISDELMPLDTRNESSAGTAVAAPSDAAGPSAATPTDKPTASDNRGDTTDSESETEQ